MSFSGTEYGVKLELGDVRKYCAEGVAEAEACGDVETQAEFLMQGVLLDMMEGSPVNHTKLLLQVGVENVNTNQSSFDDDNIKNF